MPYPITYIGSLMKVLLSRPVACIVLVHDRTRNKLNSISERTSLVTVQRSAQGRVTSGCPTIGLCDRARYLPPGRCKYETRYLCYIFLGVTALGSHR